MIEYIVNNLSTIIISLVLVGILALIVVGMYKDKKAGKSSCGGDCQNCPSACHKK